MLFTSGMSAITGALMAALKAYAHWIPNDRLPLITGFHMATGGMGALVATKPVEMALGFTDWRGVGYTLLSEWEYVSGPAEAKEGCTPGTRDAGGAQITTRLWKPVWVLPNYWAYIHVHTHSQNTCFVCSEPYEGP